MSETLTGILRALLGSFAGTVGFAMLVHVPKKSWLPCGLIAALSYLVYWLLTAVAGLADPIGIFAGSLVGSVIGQLSARKMKTIATVFVMAAVVPVVPGLGLYRMMALLGQGNMAAGGSQGIAAMITIAMIVLGVSMGSFIDRLVHPVRPEARGKTD